ncbi:MAG TPA: tyrosine-type recombinase/integrase [Chryseolinea sp.]|nr:tyrosine-type recombinase/integrase [Chryseolinea sp.]HPM28736.1 tyrosine-type recombinase/integrase [Chryseolinea sp.]
MIKSFLNYLQFEKRLSPNTLEAYQNDLCQFSDFLQKTFPDESIEKASYSIIRAWIVDLVDHEVDPRSINRKMACLRSFFKFHMKKEIISVNPMLKIVALKSKKKLPAFVKEGDIVNMLDKVIFEDTLEGWRDKLILEVFYATGIRLSELIHLKENQIDLQNRTIKVLGKRNKERVIPFALSIVPLIESYRTIRDKETVKLNHGFLFVTNNGKPCYPMMVYRIVNKYISQNTTSEKTSPHVLRHTYATHLLNKGAEINAVKDLLGHSSLAATQVYTHNSMEKLKKVFDQAHPKA